MQVVDRDPLEVFRGWSIRDQVLVRPFIDEALSLSRASSSVLPCIVECVDVL